MYRDRETGREYGNAMSAAYGLFVERMSRDYKKLEDSSRGRPDAEAVLALAIIGSVDNAFSVPFVFASRMQKV